MKNLQVNVLYMKDIKRDGQDHQIRLGKKVLHEITKMSSNSTLINYNPSRHLDKLLILMANILEIKTLQVRKVAI